MRDRVKEGQMWLLLIIVGWLILSLCGCKQVEYVPVQEVKTVEIERNGINWSDRSYGSNETTMITIKDSLVIVVNEQGNEVRREEWHEKETDREYREKYEELLLMYESLRSEKTDTIEVPYPVERKLGRWEQTCVNYGGEAIVMCVVMLFIIGWIAFKKIFR